MIYSSFGLLALVISVIINYDVFKNQKESHNIIPAISSYLNFLVGIMLYYIVDIFQGLFYEVQFPILRYVNTVIHFVLLALCTLLWTRCVIAYLNEKGLFEKIFSYAGWMFFICVAILLTINFVYPIMFAFDENGIYKSLGARYIILLVQTLIFLLTSIYSMAVMVKSDNAIKNCYRTISFFGLVMTVHTAVQMFYPIVPLYSIGFLVGTCLIHSFVLEYEKECIKKEFERLFSKEQMQQKELGTARHLAYTDSLTGVKNKNAYVEFEKETNQRIAQGKLKSFGVIVFDLNCLKEVNDTHGHNAGDKYIKKACRAICVQFKRSPVFRIGGDEFVVYLEGDDFKNRNFLIKDFNKKIEENLERGKFVVSCGFDTFRPEVDKNFHSVFERADKKMYEHKRSLKSPI